MGTTTKIIGQVPTFHGAWVEGTTYPELARVTYLGCEFQSKRGGNRSAPATPGEEPGDEITVNTADWNLISIGADRTRPGLALSGKVDAIPGKTLVDADLTQELKTKLDGLKEVTTLEAGLVGPTDSKILGRMSELYEDYYSYGVIIDTTKPGTYLQRIGNPDLHRSLPIQSGMKGCLLSDSGEIIEWLPEDSWTSAVRDGSRGQVMVRIPGHYAKFTTEGTKQIVRLSTENIPGYHYVPTIYVGAYEAAIHRPTGTLCSVVNSGTDHRGGDGSKQEWDGTYRSLLGKPVNSLGISESREKTRTRKPGSTEWNLYLYQAHKTVLWLYLVEFATANFQLPFESQPTQEGYKKGGLGSGVTTWDYESWNSYNSNMPVVPCGHTDILGNGTGETGIDILGAGGKIVRSFKVPRYRGIENIFGHLHKLIDGVYIDPSLNVRVCRDLGDIDNLNRYETLTTITLPYAHWATNIFINNHGDIFPLNPVPEKTNTSVFKSYSQFNIRDTPGLIQYGGNTHGSTYCGFLTFSISGVSTGSGTTRICYLPVGENPS